MEFGIVPISPTHDLSRFDCGDPRRNTWLQTRALDNQNADYTATYLAISPDETVLGFYSLSASSLARQAIPRNARHGAPDPVPIILLGQLAVDRSAQGQKLGDQLVIDAFRRTALAADIVGCHFLGVHPAEDWLVGYYEGLGFALVAHSAPKLMLVPVARIRQILA